jgi:hypothetical protein
MAATGALEPERLARLRAARLRALVGGRFGYELVAAAESFAFPEGAAFVARGTGFVLCRGRGARGLGAALAWARRAGADALHVVVADEEDERGTPSPAARATEDLAGRAGALARRALLFESAPVVWLASGRELVAATPALPPEEPALPGGPPERLIELIRRAGAEPVLEQGVLRAEVLGLEVARAVPEAHGWRLDVGVGRHDREAQRMLHRDEPSIDALAAAVEVVRRHRRAGALPHPANQLSVERWLRAVLVERPALVGARALRPVAGPIPSASLSARAPAIAAGIDGDGSPVVVACSTGVDLELVPEAADARLAVASFRPLPPGPVRSDGEGGALPQAALLRSAGARPWPRLVLAVPEGDDLPVTRALAAALSSPAEVRTVPAGWRGLASSG